MSPASFCGMPLQIFMDGSTAGVEHLSGAKSFRFEIGVGFCTHARSCSEETIHTERQPQPQHGAQVRVSSHDHTSRTRVTYRPAAAGPSPGTG